MQVGFEPEGVLTMPFGLGEERFPEPSVQTAALESPTLRAEPGEFAKPGPEIERYA